jgi:DNA-binding MarR family transcriptional regulator
MTDFTTFICFNLKATNKKVEKYLTAGFEEFGINVAQSFIIMSLLAKDGSTLTEIGAHAQIENSSLTTMVDKLEKSELVERKLDAQDRRVIRLYLTPKGRDLAERVLQAGIEFNAYLRGILDGAEENLLKSLSAIADSLNPGSAGSE